MATKVVKIKKMPMTGGPSGGSSGGVVVKKPVRGTSGGVVVKKPVRGSGGVAVGKKPAPGLPPLPGPFPVKKTVIKKTTK